MKKFAYDVLLRFMIFDLAVYRLCTRISHAAQRNVGITNYMIAKAALLLSGFCILCDVLLDTQGSTWWILFCAIYIAIQWSQIRSAERSGCDSGVISREALELMKGWGLRVLYVILDFEIGGAVLRMAVEGRFHWPKDIFVPGICWSFTVAMYFAAVIPLPPSRSKLREWFGNLGRSVVPCAAES